MTDFKTQYDLVDLAIATAQANGGTKVPCRKGCFHCCYEPVYASKREMQYAIGNMTDERREALRQRVEAWYQSFISAGLLTANMPGAFAYRTLKMPCPLLNTEDGTCSVYDRRPIECRFHFALYDKSFCADDKKRPQQKYGMLPPLIEAVMQERMAGLEDGESEIMDHLGIILSELLLDHSVEFSGSRMEFKRTGNTIEKIEQQ